MEENKKQNTIKEVIYNHLREGMCKKDSAIMAGISEATFYRWVSEDDSFDSRVEANILEYKHSLIKKVNIAADKDGRLALEVLSRRFPREWGQNNRIDDNENENSIQAIADMLQKVILEEHDLPRIEA